MQLKILLTLETENLDQCEGQAFCDMLVDTIISLGDSSDTKDWRVILAKARVLSIGDLSEEV